MLLQDLHAGLEGEVSARIVPAGPAPVRDQHHAVRTALFWFQAHARAHKRDRVKVVAGAVVSRKC